MTRSSLTALPADPPSPAQAATLSSVVPETAYPVIAAISFAHLLNDMMQSLVPALYPILKTSYGLDFAQIGLITMAFQFTASMLHDLEKGAVVEADHVVGDMIARARKAGLATPNLRLAYAHLQVYLAQRARKQA